MRKKSKNAFKKGKPGGNCLRSEQTNRREASVFDKKSVREIHKEIQEIYLEDDRPWIVGYSGGKDSTTALQLVWYALAELPPEKRQKPVYVISSDTLVETPTIVDFIDNTIHRINETAASKAMPFHAEKVRPIISDSYWTNLLGKGYPAPQSRFRWCTDRLKIHPANKFILDKVAQYGEVIVVLGVRRSESATRAQVMSLHKIKGSLLSRHTHFPRAFVYTPIEDFSVDDVWMYLLQAPSPWGNVNRELVTLYRNAQGGECPLVVDDLTPPCGGSRFGCWVCTLIERDKTMESLVQAGEDWLKPLLDFRDFLTTTQDPAKKHIYREYKRRSGQVYFKRDGSGIIVRGPYKLSFCMKLLRRLLQIQLQLREEGPDPNIILILPEELHEIRRIWRTERGDWEDSVPEIYREVTGEDLNWIQDDLVVFTEKEKNLLTNICKKQNVPTRLVTKLLDLERQLQGMKRRSTIFSGIDSIFHEEWRSEEKILQEKRNKLENFLEH